MKTTLIVTVSAAFLLLSTGSHAVTRPAVQPGQSWDAAREAAAPGDVIPVAAGNHPSQSISCNKAAPGVTFQATGRVVVGNAGASENCLAVVGTYLSVTGVETSYYGADRQCGVAGRTRRSPPHAQRCGRRPFLDRSRRRLHHRRRLRTDARQGVEVQRAHLFATNFTCMPKRPLIGGNRFSCAEQAVSNAVKFSNHGFRYTNAVMRNNHFDCQETFVASSTASQLLYEGNTGGGLHLNNGVPKAEGTHSQGQTVVTVRSAAGPPPPPPPTNAAPTACFTRDPSPSRAGQAITFNASCSTDPDGDALTYSCDIAPGGDGVYERSGSTTSYAYQSAGNKTPGCASTTATGTS